MVPVLTRVPTKQPVVFLSIDDGVTKRAEALAALQHYGYPVTMFLTKNTIQNDPEYFRGFQALGNRIQNHTVSHDTTMWAKPFAYQYAEIKVMQDYAQEAFGRAPTLFRPPGGRYSKATRRAAGQAGLKAIIDWEALVSGGQMQYQVGAKLRPGDIVLMHFRPEFEADLKAFHQARLEAGLKVQRLDDFLGV
ncbi:transposase [Psychromicrobium lacuslunae]|uniref:Transposase n=1 Tax=Psychromicrobium lacuslunae TaxID=1618207 RepID=A0A0D4C361_9MICC|nr:transposase [Psychromicrobium lacuslunae]